MRYSPNPPPLPLHFVPLLVNLIRIIIRAQASEARASASPSVDLPLLPPHFFPFFFQSSAPLLSLWLSHLFVNQSIRSCISHFTVFANYKHIIYNSIAGSRRGTKQKRKVSSFWKAEIIKQRMGIFKNATIKDSFRHFLTGLSVIFLYAVVKVEAWESKHGYRICSSLHKHVVCISRTSGCTHWLYHFTFSACRWNLLSLKCNV